MTRSTFSAWLYIWLAVGPFLITALNSTEAKQYIPPLWLWITATAFGALNIAAAALKSFRSTEHADQLEKQNSEDTKPTT